jgi:phytanoyl-CoA dioxygenase PhyH
MTLHITEQQWHSYDEVGYLKLGKLLCDDDLTALQRRIDDIMLGTAGGIDYAKIMMQLDSGTGRYEDAPEQTRGHKGATLAYRKIQDLEHDPLFLQYLQQPIFREICRRVYGADVPIACFRAMFMNKPAHQGTLLPWHQDRWTHLDRDPLITLWTALDPATIANGCVQVIPATHRRGLINPQHSSGFLTPEQSAAELRRAEPIALELKPGEAVLLHNYLLHSSDVNRTPIPRRAFSVCYMDARTQGGTFTRVFGTDDVD